MVLTHEWFPTTIVLDANSSFVKGSMARRRPSWACLEHDKTWPKILTQLHKPYAQRLDEDFDCILHRMRIVLADVGTALW